MINYTILNHITILTFFLFLLQSNQKMIKNNFKNKNNDETIEITSNYIYPKKNDSQYYYITIFGTNDIHGKVFPVVFTNPNDPNNQYYYGGIEYIYAYKKVLKEEWGDRFLWLDAGDQFQGGLEFMLSNGTIMKDFYNYVGLDGMTIGNHEFDYEIEYLKSRIENDTFPYLVSNININNKPLYEEWKNVINGTIYQLDKVKIGVIGLATLQTKTTTSGNLNGLEFLDYYDIIVKESKILKEKGANAIVLLTHFGLVCYDEENITSMYDINIYNSTTVQNKCKDSEELNLLLNKLNTSIVDVVVAGHTHFINHHWINGIPVIQSTGNQYSHVMYIPFDENLNIVREKIQIEGPLPSCEKIFTKNLKCTYVKPGDKSFGNLIGYTYHNKLIQIDEELAKILSDWKKIIFEKYNNVIVKNNLAEDMYTNNGNETTLTNLVVDVLKIISHSDFSFYNTGGYRTSWYVGKLNEVDLFLMFPFNNTLVSFEMTGEEVLRMLKNIQKNTIYPSSGLMQIIKFRKNKLQMINAQIFDGENIQNIEKNKTYTVCTNDFLAQGGSAFYNVRKWYTPRNYKEYGIIRDLVTQYMKNFEYITRDMFVDERHPRLVYVA